eukprot:6756651-Ditylum_brightwellii.AAC.1
MPNKKKSSRRGVAYTTAKKHLLVTNMSIIFPILELGWERVHGMHIDLYGGKNLTVESLRHCFTNIHCTKVPSGDPVIVQEIREAQMMWLQIQAKSECLTGSSEESVLESKEEDDKEED